MFLYIYLFQVDTLANRLLVPIPDYVSPSLSPAKRFIKLGKFENAVLLSIYQCYIAWYDKVV